MTGKWPGLLVALIAVLVLPWLLGNDFYINLASQIGIFALLALSLNILIGFGGMTSLGHVVYMGCSAYACAWLTANLGVDPLLAVVGALAFSVVMAALFGVLALRATGLSFLMITLALGQIMWGVAYRWVALTGGDNGIRLPRRPSPFGIDISGAIPFYYFVAVIFALGFFFIWRISESPYGACLRGTRDQAKRMQMLGHNVWMIRWIAFILAGFLGAVSGILYIYYHKFVSPHALSLQQSAEVLLMVILGGASTLTGPIVGAIIITLIKNVASSYLDRWATLLGLTFIVVVVFMPDGLVPGFKRLWMRLTSRTSIKAGKPPTERAS